MSKPRRGRPPRADKAATERIEIRVTKIERAVWEHAAALADVSVSEWIRACCRAECEAVQGEHRVTRGRPAIDLGDL